LVYLYLFVLQYHQSKKGQNPLKKYFKVTFRKTEAIKLLRVYLPDAASNTRAVI